MIEKIKQIKKSRITFQIEKIFENTDVINVGFTTIAFSPTSKKRHILSIEHSGNMGNSIQRSVNPNIQRIGLPTISDLKDIYNVIDEKGSPDYYYSIKFDFKIINQK